MIVPSEYVPGLKQAMRQGVTFGPRVFIQSVRPDLVELTKMQKRKAMLRLNNRWKAKCAT